VPLLLVHAGLALLQPSHRSLVKPAFTAVAKALEAVGSPWAKLRAALHLEVAKAEADADSFMKVRLMCFAQGRQDVVL
jgi:hypothetical protein